MNIAGGSGHHFFSTTNPLDARTECSLPGKRGDEGGEGAGPSVRITTESL